MITIIISIVSLIFDGLLTNYLPYLVNNLSFFTPLFTVTILFIIYPCFKKNTKKYLIFSFILGLIYDLLYTNLLFFNAVIFVVISLISKYIYKNYEVTYLRLILYIILIIISYELITSFILIIFRVVPITPYKVLYKITHSLIINILYGELIHFILNIIPKKYRKVSIY